MKRTHLLSIVFLSAAFGPALRAGISTDCGAMLKPLFDYAAAKDSNHVYATVTRHYGTGSKLGGADPVYYSAGEVLRHLNVVTFPTTQDFRAVLPMQNSPYFLQVVGQVVSVKVSQSGWVQIQETQAGVLYIPQHFQATCSPNLLTAVVGSASYAISFTTASSNVP